MITVKIFINDREINSISGVNVSEKLGIPYGKGKQQYQLYVPNDEIISHKYEDGAIKLAIKMLRVLSKWEKDIK